MRWETCFARACRSSECLGKSRRVRTCPCHSLKGSLSVVRTMSAVVSAKQTAEAVTSVVAATNVAEGSSYVTKASADVSSRGSVVAIARPGVLVVRVMTGVMPHGPVVATPFGVDHCPARVCGFNVPDAASRGAMVRPCLGRADREGGSTYNTNHAHGSKSSSQHHRTSCHLSV